MTTKRPVQRSSRDGNNVLTVDQATAIINEAKSFGITDAPMPEEDASKLEQANDLVADANRAFRANVKPEVVMTILGIAGETVVADAPQHPSEQVEPEPVAEFHNPVPEGITAPPELMTEEQIKFLVEMAEGVGVDFEGLNKMAVDTHGEAVVCCTFDEGVTLMEALKKMEETVPPFDEAPEDSGSEEIPAGGSAVGCPETERPVEKDSSLLPPKRRNRKRASDGTLQPADELAHYEATLVENLAWLAQEQAESDEVPEAETPAVVNFIDKRYADSALAEARIAKERLPIPDFGDVVPPQLPADFTLLSDVDIRRYHSIYHACFARASYLLACEEADETAAQRIHDYQYHIVLRKEMSNAGTDAKVTMAKATANLDGEVAEWKEVIGQHHALVKRLKMLVSIYDGSCTRLSREWSMRESDVKSAGGLR